MEKRQRFTAEFKREALRLLKASGKPAAVIARQLGIPRNRLYKWASDAERQGEQAFRGSGRPKASRDGKLGSECNFAVRSHFGVRRKRLASECDRPLRVEGDVVKPRNLLAIAFALSASDAAFAQFVVQTGTNAERVVDLSRRSVSAWEEPQRVAMGWSESRTPTAVFGEPPLFAAVAREGQPMPAGESGTLGYMGFNPGTLDSSGRVAFVADVDGAERNQGVFFADANGLKVVAMGCGAIGGYGSTADCGDPSRKRGQVHLPKTGSGSLTER